MRENGYRVGVLGATGAVGSTILEVLAERSFPVDELVAFASERSAGRELEFAGGRVECRELSDETIQGLDLVLSSAGGAVSSEWVPRLVAAGAVVVDNTSFWRMHPDVPLVIPEVNPARGRRPQRPRRQPELLDDAARRRAGADRAGGGDRADRHLHLPVGLGHRSAGRRRASRPGPRAAPRAGPGAATSIRTGSPSTCSRRSRPSRTATTTRPRSASSWPRRGRSSSSPTRTWGSRRPARGCPCSSATRSR